MPENPRKPAPYKYDSHKGLLFAALDRVAFEEVIALIQKRSKNAEIANVSMDKVFHLYVGDASHQSSQPLPFEHRKDRLAILAYAFIAIAFGGVLGMGILAIGELLWSSR